MSKRTARQIDVRVGDVWRDNDSRYRDVAPFRELRIVRITRTHAIMENLRTKRHTLVALSRLKPTTNGYKLVKRGSSDV